MTASVAPAPVDRAVPTGRIWNIPDRSVGLAGHRQLLAAVHRTLRVGERALLCTDARRAGTGATTAAVEFAHRHARDYDVAWRIPAADPELVPIELAALADALGLAQVTDDAETATSRLLDALRHRDRYLLVFDDAESPRQLARFLPAGAGDVVIVSADPAWRTHATAHPVEPFTRAESVALLRARRPDLPVDVAARFAAALADLPLAVDPAATLLAASGTDVGQLLGRLDQVGHGGRPDPAAAVWDVAFEHLAAENPAALALLTLVAWLGPEPVPLHLVTDHPHALPPVLADVARDPAVFDRLTTDLRRRGLARLTHESITLHRVPAALLVARTAAEHSGRRHGRLGRRCRPAAAGGRSWLSRREGRLGYLAAVTAARAGRDRPRTPPRPGIRGCGLAAPPRRPIPGCAWSTPGRCAAVPGRGRPLRRAAVARGARGPRPTRQADTVPAAA